jgi:tetratricopeptide (TPR) repeat protein
MKTKYKYKAFISYSHVDQKWARWLHRSLESYRTPKRLAEADPGVARLPGRLSPIFRDRDELASSPDLSERINSALVSSENLLVICSPAAAKSRWVNQEIETFKKLGRSDRVFCIIVEGDPTAAATDIDCFPPAIRSRYDETGNVLPGNAEPIAADVRKQGDGKSLARIKVIAGLLNVGLDDLRQRESQKKQRRMALITVSSLLGVAFAIVLAVNATLARNEATQRKIQAEGLLNFMLGDLRSSLTPIGRLDLLEGVGEQAMSYFATVDVTDLTDGELLKQAQVMTQLGEIRFSQLQYDDALSSFMEAYERSSALQSNDPGDGDRLFNRSQAEFWIGFTHWRSGDFIEAKLWLTRYRDSALGLINLDSSNTDWIREVGFGYHNLAVLDQEAGNLEASIEGFNLELETLRNLKGLDSSLSLLRDMADASSWLGNIAVMQGDLEGATEYYKRSMEEIEHVSQQDPDNAGWLNDLAFAVQLLAETILMTGQLEEAENFLDISMSIFDGLVIRDENNTNWVRASTKPRISKGYLMQARNQSSEAKIIAERVITLLEKIRSQATEDHNVHDHLADAYHLIAWIHQSSDEIDSGLEAIDKAILNMEALQLEGRLDTERTGKLATIYLAKAELQSISGNDPAAQNSLQSARDLLTEKVANSKAHYLLDPWTRSLLMDGRKEEARQIIDELSARQYLPLKPWPD